MVATPRCLSIRDSSTNSAGGVPATIPTTPATPKSGRSSWSACATIVRPADSRLLAAHRPRHPRRERGDHDRRASASAADGSRRFSLLFPAINVNDCGHQVEVRQPLRHPPFAGRRHQPRHRRHARRKDCSRVRAMATSARAARQHCEGQGCSRHGHRDRSNLRVAGCDGGLPGRAARRRHGYRRHLHHHDRQQGHHLGRPHGPHEAPGHRGQRRTLRQRNRHGWPRQA